LFLDANADPTVKSTQQTDVSGVTSSLDSSSIPVPSASTSKKKSKKKSESNGSETIEEDSLADILKQGKTKFGSGASNAFFSTEHSGIEKHSSLLACRKAPSVLGHISAALDPSFCTRLSQAGVLHCYTGGVHGAC